MENKKVDQIKWRLWQKKLTAKQKLRDFSQWAAENSELIVVLVPLGTAAIAGLLGMGRSAIVSHRLTKEERRRALTIYDPSARHSWELRRPLSNSEWLTVSRRSENGEKLSDILESMKVLK